MLDKQKRLTLDSQGSLNVVFIGMPGSGKTTIGKIIADKLKREFVDVDFYITKSQGKTIEEIFEGGEANFRELETKAIQDIANKTNIVIATGGGVVKNPVNIEILQRNGIIIFIDRPLSEISNNDDLKTRPLIKNDPLALERLYSERYELYREYSDSVIKNTGAIEDTVRLILETLDL